MNNANQLLTLLVRQDPLRSQALTCLRLVNLPQGYIAAGFVRNLVWDHLHTKIIPTPLNDVDVIYFDKNEVNVKQYINYQDALNEIMPQINWQVRNQAFMHIRNGDSPYASCLDAMSYWPEKETAVAMRELPSGQLECIAAFGFNSLFNLQLSYNPKRKKDVFDKRVNTKGWLKHWQKLSVNST